MSSKVSRKTTTTSSASSTSFSTPQESTSTSQERARSPLSPARLSRLQEKNEMQNLNDRLSQYITTVRQLQNENSRLIKEVKITQETLSREKTSYKQMCANEMSDLRRALDETSSEKARFEIENKRIVEQNEDLKSSFERQKKKLQSLEANLNLSESRYADLQCKYNRAVADLKRQDEDAKELDNLRKALEAERKAAENETLSRVEIENKLLSLREQFAFAQEAYQKEVSELQHRRVLEVEEIDGRLTVQYEDKLQSALQELREQHDQQIQANREEITELYENKLQRLLRYQDQNTKMEASVQEELRTLQTRFDTVNGKLNTLEAQNSVLSARVQDLERLLERERTLSTEKLAQKEQELSQLRQEMNNHLNEYRDLMDIKLSLDSEIASYRKLLEIEEDRLNITPSVQRATTAATASTRRGTPSRRGGTPLASKVALKRRRVLDESEQLDTYQVNAEAKDDIEITKVDAEGKFIQLVNKGNKDISLGSWTLKHRVGEQETSFKFHRSVKVEPKATVTVWGADSGQAHEPPTNIVMKQKWFVGEQTSTTLASNDGEEMATMQRKRMHHSSSSFREEGDVLDGDEQRNPEQCSVM